MFGKEPINNAPPGKDTTVGEHKTDPPEKPLKTVAKQKTLFPDSLAGPRNNMVQLKREICSSFGISEADLTGRCRTKSLVMARKLFAARARIQCGASLNEIGAMLGGRDHTTIMHYLKMFKR